MDSEYTRFGLPAETSSQPCPRGWFSRNIWWLLPVSFLAIAMPVGCCAGIFLWVIGSLKSSEPYQMALNRVRADRQVITILGQPIKEASWMPTGNFSYHINNGVALGTATFSFAISGPKDSAVVHAEAMCRNGKWEFRLLEVTTSGGRVISLRGGKEQTIYI
jgi:hypothetical protein